MGNKISYGCDDEHLRFSILLPKEINVKDFIQEIEKIPTMRFNILEETSIINIRIHCYHVSNLLKSEKFLETLKILQSENINNNFRAKEIFFFGFGFDSYQKFFEEILPKQNNLIFKDEKQIKHIVGSILLMKKNKWKTFYRFTDVVPITQIDKIPQKIPIDKIFYKPEEIPDNFLLVNVKGGVSYYHVDTINGYKRIGGSILGESAFKALMSMSTDYLTSDEAISEWKKGDSTKIDMTVEDIYGDGLTNLGLSKDIIASSFGKAVKNLNKLKFEKQDLMRSLLTMLSINIGQISWLYSEIEKTENIFVVSSKISDEAYNFMFQSFLNFYTKGEKRIFFVQNEEFLATLNPLLR